MKRTAPLLTDFFTDVIGCDRAIVGNTIRKCREAGLISQGRPGHGAAAVTSRDAASVLLAILGGATPLEAAAMLREIRNYSLNTCVSGGELLEKPPEIPGLAASWCQNTLLDALVANIEARLHDPAFHGVDQISVTRGFAPRATLRWWDTDNRRYEFEYAWSQRQTDAFEPALEHPPSQSLIFNIAECPGRALTDLADWLQGKDHK